MLVSTPGASAALLAEPLAVAHQRQVAGSVPAAAGTAGDFLLGLIPVEALDEELDLFIREPLGHQPAGRLHRDAFLRMPGAVAALVVVLGVFDPIDLSGTLDVVEQVENAKIQQIKWMKR
jgi:hypothetical protein